MIAYFGIIAAAAVLFVLGHQVASTGISPRRATYFDVLAVAVLALFSGLRYGIGTDYFLYKRIWDIRIDPGSVLRSVGASGQEIGFVTLASLLKSAGIGFEGFVLLMSVVTVVAASAALWLLSDLPRRAILLFVCLGPYLASMNIVRQGLAVALVLLWYALWKRRSRGVWMWVVALAAFSVHYSAIVIVPFIIVIRLILRTGRGSGLLIGGLLAGVGAVILVGGDLLLGIIELLNPRYATYLGSSESGLGTILGVVVRLAIVVWAAFVMRRTGSAAAWSPEIALVGAGALFLLLGLVSTPAGRMDEYLWPLAAVLVPATMQARRSSVLAWTVLMILALAFMAAYLLSFGGLVPYAWVVGRPH